MAMYKVWRTQVQCYQKQIHLVAERRFEPGTTRKIIFEYLLCLMFSEVFIPKRVIISDAAAEHATSRKQFNRTLSEFGQIQVFKLKSILIAYDNYSLRLG